MSDGTGFGVYSFGKLEVATVSPTRRSALVNWLHTKGGCPIFRWTTDEEIERHWRDFSGRDHECVAVIVRRLPQENADV